jgi:hypothetical protein
MSGWPKLNRPGKVTIEPSGKVYVENFDVTNASCRQACMLAMAWAQQQLAAAIVEDMTADYPNLSAID